MSNDELVKAVFTQMKEYLILALPLVMDRTRDNDNVTADDIAKDAWSIAAEMIFCGNREFKKIEEFFNRQTEKNDE